MSDLASSQDTIRPVHYDDPLPHRAGSHFEAPTSRRPLVVHIIHRLAVGGLENGLVNLINHMPEERYRHAILCLTHDTDFRERIHSKDVQIMALHKQQGLDLRLYSRVWRALRQLKPDIVHTRNLSALECLVPAAMTRIPGRVHGVHGRDMYDLNGISLKYNLLRRAIKPLVHRYVSVSMDMADWLVNTVGVRPERVTQIYNGVDTDRFRPTGCAPAAIGTERFAPTGTFVVGTVGRLEAVKDQLTLVRAFIHLIETEPIARARLRLVLIGDGPLRKEAALLLHEAQAEDISWLPGERGDIPEIMRSMDLFVLPSLAEGISNTILEAMASGLPVVATRVGGNPELVEEGRTGRLVPPSDPIAMAEAIRGYLINPREKNLHGRAGLATVQERFSMKAMVNGYLGVYDEVLREKGKGHRAWGRG
jgi:sugar transferase (PEP-CTERM/EpsH1 system associated)